MVNKPTASKPNLPSNEPRFSTTRTKTSRRRRIRWKSISFDDSISGESLKVLLSDEMFCMDEISQILSERFGDGEEGGDIVRTVCGFLCGIYAYTEAPLRSFKLGKYFKNTVARNEDFYKYDSSVKNLERGEYNCVRGYVFYGSNVKRGLRRQDSHKRGWTTRELMLKDKYTFKPNKDMFVGNLQHRRKVESKPVDFEESGRSRVCVIPFDVPRFFVDPYELEENYSHDYLIIDIKTCEIHCLHDNTSGDKSLAIHGTNSFWHMEKVENSV